MTVVKRGKRWGAWVYLGQGRWLWLGSFDTRREAKAAEAKAQLERRRHRTNETCDSFAERGVRDFPRPRETTNRHNAERIKSFARDFAGVRLSGVDRVMARSWAQANPQIARYARTLFEDARNDGLGLGGEHVAADLFRCPPQDQGDRFKPCRRVAGVSRGRAQMGALRSATAGRPSPTA
jgi:hypothetical protein